MRNILLGAVAGLLLGMIGALAYDHFLGDGSLLADLQAQLDAAKSALAKSDEEKRIFKRTTESAAQIDQLQASKADGKGAADDETKTPTATPAPPPPRKA